jgi:hypothetical protein
MLLKINAVRMGLDLSPLSFALLTTAGCLLFIASRTWYLSQLSPHQTAKIKMTFLKTISSKREGEYAKILLALH